MRISQDIRDTFKDQLGTDLGMPTFGEQLDPDVEQAAEDGMEQKPRSFANRAARSTWRNPRLYGTNNSKPHLDSAYLNCYFVTGRAVAEPTATPSGDEIAQIVGVATKAAMGGAGIIQIRSKPITVRALTELAIKVAAAVRK